VCRIVKQLSRLWVHIAVSLLFIQARSCTPRRVPCPYPYHSPTLHYQCVRLSHVSPSQLESAHVLVRRGATAVCAVVCAAMCVRRLLEGCWSAAQCLLAMCVYGRTTTTTTMTTRRRNNRTSTASGQRLQRRHRLQRLLPTRYVQRVGSHAYTEEPYACLCTGRTDTGRG
jgi:hypothetical protein